MIGLGLVIQFSPLILKKGEAMKTRITICAIAVLSLLLAVVSCDTSEEPEALTSLVMVGVYQTHQEPRTIFEIFVAGEWTGFGGWNAPFTNFTADSHYDSYTNETRLRYEGNPPIPYGIDPTDICYFGYGYGHSDTIPYKRAHWWWETPPAYPMVWPTADFPSWPKVPIDDGLLNLSNQTGSDDWKLGVTLEIWDVGYLFFNEQQPHESMTEEGMPPKDFTRPNPDLFPQPFTLPPGEDTSFEIQADEVTGDYMVLFFSSREYNPDEPTEEVKVWTQVPAKYEE